MTPGAVRLSVVIPTYQEAEVIARTLAALRSALEPVGRAGGVELIVADDGSTDGTAALAAPGADAVIRLPAHAGKGAAVRAGVREASGSTVAFTDADLAYSPEQLLRLLDEVEAGHDVVVGSRRHVDTVTLVRARRTREVMGRAFNTLTRVLLLGGQHRDTQCGIKAFSADAARRIFAAARVDGFAFDVEIFLLADRLGLSLREVPVELSNSDRSTVRAGRDPFSMIRDLIRIRWWASSGGYPGGGRPRAAQ